MNVLLLLLLVVDVGENNSLEASDSRKRRLESKAEVKIKEERKKARLSVSIVLAGDAAKLISRRFPRCAHTHMNAKNCIALFSRERADRKESQK